MNKSRPTKLILKFAGLLCLEITKDPSTAKHLLVPEFLRQG